MIFDDALKAGFWEGYSWDKYCELDRVFVVPGERFSERDMKEDRDLGFDRILGELVFNFGREVQYNAEELPDRKISDVQKGLAELRGKFWMGLNRFEFSDGVLGEISSSFTGLMKSLSEFLSNL